MILYCSLKRIRQCVFLVDSLFKFIIIKLAIIGVILILTCCFCSVS
ncbi:hypothetical protein EVA_20765 [gut metagenome]|uniref:Uncharacterized protein n=1 Tax=gut metagenome TaxID=749906 RepID=J9F9L2_9ZZZZ